MDKLLPFSRPRPDEPTAREREILNHIWAGLTSQEIAARLQIAPKTVESHRANLLRKFRASNSAQLLRLALLEASSKFRRRIAPRRSQLRAARTIPKGCGN